MLGRTPGNIIAVRPLSDGVISDYDFTAKMLKEFLKVACKQRLMGPKVIVCVPSGVTEVEKRAVEEVVRQMGAKEVYILEEPMAAAIGTGLAVNNAMGCMIADIGGGTTDIAIISLGGIVTSTSIRHAGDKLNETIVQYMRKKYNVLIGDKTAEEIKVTIGCAYLDESNQDAIKEMKARGRDLLSGLPRTISITSVDVMKALEEPIKIIIDEIKNTLENAPPEIAADIVSNGLVLSGGSGLISGLDKLIELSTGLKVVTAENALEAVAEGTGKSLLHIEKIHTYAGRGRKK